MSLDPVQREMVRAAVQEAGHVAETMTLAVRPGVVVAIDPTNTTALVQPDGPLTGDTASEPFGADVVAPITLHAGDRVMLLFVPPHGCLVLGRRSGDWDDWHVVGNEGEPDYDGGKGVRWDHAPGTVYPGQAGPSVPSFTRRGGRVELRGNAARVAGSNNNVFPLPQGYRPENDLMVLGVTGLGVSTLVGISASTGMITVPAGPSNVVLDGISFVCRTLTT